MNYANVFGRTQKQFDMTMNREKITVADFFNSDTKYDVFFRRNQRSTTPQGKVRFFYAQSTPIHIGTIFVLNGENYIVTSQDGIESDIYFTSIAVKSDMTYKVKTDKGTASIPFVVVSDKWTVAHGTITQLNGAVALYTGYNSAVENIKVNDSFKGFGNYYKVGNTFKNNNLFYLYLEQTQAPIDNYKIEYTGVSSFDMKKNNTYQLTYSVTNNDSVIVNPTITYQSSANDVATVDENGLMTMLKEGSVDITATAYGASCTTTMTIANTSAPAYTLSLTTSSYTIKVNGTYKTMTCRFADKDGQDITDSLVTELSANDFTWTCAVGSTDLTNNSAVVWANGSAVNTKKLKLTDGAYDYLGQILTVKVTVNGVTASKDLEITE
nr:MAG TPA: Ig-like domain protein [Caudoviricetes sp.]